ILRLPITGDPIEITPREQQQRALVRLYRDRSDDSEIVSGAVRISSQYRQDSPRSRRIALIQMANILFCLARLRRWEIPIATARLRVRHLAVQTDFLPSLMP
ncbi:hypothetical protein KI387_014861, partial [Taxus chinensis]